MVKKEEQGLSAEKGKEETKPKKTLTLKRKVEPTAEAAEKSKGAVGGLTTVKRKQVFTDAQGRKRQLEVKIKKAAVPKPKPEPKPEPIPAPIEEKIEQVVTEPEVASVALTAESAEISAAPALSEAVIEQQAAVPESLAVETKASEAVSSPAVAEVKPVAKAGAAVEEETEEQKAAKKKKKPKYKEEAAPDDSRGGKKLGLPEIKTHRVDFLGGYEEEEEPASAPARVKMAKRRGLRKKPEAPVRIIRDVQIPETITVSELAKKIAVKVGEVIKALLKMGIVANLNHSLDQDTAILVASEMGMNATPLQIKTVEDKLNDYLDKIASTAKALPRPPVVTVMGHVDHGKTSLLDYIRKTKVVAKEAGGITQHIGAYNVTCDKGVITFLDTPGHAAFSTMRARGANCTDLVVLVVAADDGVMAQTVEAIQHAKAAQVPIVIAVNKIDKPGADPERIKTELTKYEIVPEEWGGSNQFIEVSAKTGQGIDNLLDAILVQAEILELTAPVDTPARGVIIESRLDKARGPVATVLVQSGTLNRGDILLSGGRYGRIKTMLGAMGEHLKSAAPSIPVEVLGLSGVPAAGDEAEVVDSEARAREVAEFRLNKQRTQKFASQRKDNIKDLFEKIEQGEPAVLSVVLKTDVQGSLEALRSSLEDLATSEVKVNIVGSGIGAISESDVFLAIAAKAILIGFNVRPDAVARKLIDESGVHSFYHNIIYNVIDDVKKLMSGMLSPQIREKIMGLAQVREVFRSSKFGVIAGCMVIDGLIKRNNPIRLLRDNVVIYEGSIESLRRFKDDVSEVRKGLECGIGVKDYQDLKANDQIESFERVEVEREL